MSRYIDRTPPNGGVFVPAQRPPLGSTEQTALQAFKLSSSTAVQRIDAKPQKMISEGLKILAFLQLKLRWPANPGQGPEGAVAQRRVACRALSGAGLAAQYLST